ncbi:hypothetical protein [Asanoa hainanensis]|uniref:hypothetical protein n=1 Tax=Asanoa hainanensis TaxID=560556 RepID=UPI00117EA5E7|nr:hypothetical protein [Asanoa hainanensis]
MTYAVGPTATVVAVDAGDRPGGSGLSTRDRLSLRSPFPRAAAERLGGSRQDRPIHGFVRTPSGWVPLGLLRVTMTGSRPTGSVPFTWNGADVPWEPEWLVECALTLDDPLPFDVLDVVRPTPPAPPSDLSWLSHLPDSPISAMHGFVASWYADLPPTSDGIVDAPLPRPLLELYRAARGRHEVLCWNNRIFPPEEIYPSDDGPGIVIGSENQGVFRLRIDPAEADPQVWYLDLFDPPPGGIPSNDAWIVTLAGVKVHS